MKEKCHSKHDYGNLIGGVIFFTRHRKGSHFYRFSIKKHDFINISSILPKQNFWNKLKLLCHTHVIVMGY